MGAENGHFAPGLPRSTMEPNELHLTGDGDARAHRTRQDLGLVWLGQVPAPGCIEIHGVAGGFPHGEMRARTADWLVEVRVLLAEQDTGRRRRQPVSAGYAGRSTNVRTTPVPAGTAGRGAIDSTGGVIVTSDSVTPRSQRGPRAGSWSPRPDQLRPRTALLPALLNTNRIQPGVLRPKAPELEGRDIACDRSVADSGQRHTRG